MEPSWAQQATDRFFQARRSPSQSECDSIALRISGASRTEPVAVPGSFSYTVLCKAYSSPRQDLIVSFRESESTLDQAVISSAKSIHGDLVPEATYHGKVPGANPPLLIYTMPCLPGIPCLDVISAVEELSPEEEARHVCFVKYLARYFARCWLNQQTYTQAQTDYQNGIYRRFAQLKASPNLILPLTLIRNIEDNIPGLFHPEYPQVLTHNDLSQTNILVDESTFKITGIIDWSLASVLPFGMELDILFLSTGYMDLNGWNSYTCHRQLIDSFWEEFWAQSGIDDDLRRYEIKAAAMQAMKVGAVLRYAFKCNADGSPPEEPTTSGWSLKTLTVLLEI